MESTSPRSGGAGRSNGAFPPCLSIAPRAGFTAWFVQELQAPQQRPQGATGTLSEEQRRLLRDEFVIRWKRTFPVTEHSAHELREELVSLFACAGLELPGCASSNAVRHIANDMKPARETAVIRACGLASSIAAHIVPDNAHSSIIEFISQVRFLCAFLVHFWFDSYVHFWFSCEMHRQTLPLPIRNPWGRGMTAAGRSGQT